MANEREELLIRDRVTQQPRPYYVHADNINLGDENNYQGLPAKLQQMTQAFTPDSAFDERSTRPIQNGVVKAAIDAINRAIDQLVGSDDVTTYIDSFNEVITFLAGVTNNETLTAKLYELQQAINSKQATLTFDDAPTQSSDNMVKSGGIYSALADKANAAETYTKTAVDEMVETLRQAGTAIVTLEKTRILDEHDNNTVLAAPSARQMALAATNIETLFTKVNDLYDKLAGVAFTDGKPANWKVNADWVGDGVTQYTLSFGTLSGIDSVKDRYGNTIDTSTTSQVNEGYLKLILKPSSASHVFTSILVNGDAVQATPVSGASDGSVYIEITVAGNVTVAATAISGRGIDFSGSSGCTIDDAGVPNGQDLDTTLRANEHFTLPESITVKVGTTTLSSSNYTYSRASGNATATLFIDKQYITDDLTIICEAVEDKHVVLDLSNVGSGVTVKQGNVTLQNDAHIYHGEAAVTLTISPKSGYKHTSAPTATIDGTSASVSGSSVYGDYTLEIGTSVSADTVVAITAANATALTTYSVTPPSDAHITTTLNGNTITSATNVQEGSAATIVLTPDSDYAIAITTKTMGSDTLSDPTNSNGVLTFSIDHVTGNIVIAASATEVVMYNVRKHLLNSTASNSASSVESGSDYTTNILIDNGCTSNDDLRVIIGGVDVTSSCTIEDITGGKSLSIPSSVIDSDIDIIATAATGTITVKCNENNASIFLGKDQNNNNVSVTCSTDNGDGTYSGSVSGVTALSNFSLWNKSNVVEIDFGGAKVVPSSNQFRNCPALTKIDNLVYSGGSSLSSAFIGSTAFASLDLSYCEVDSVTDFQDMFNTSGGNSTLELVKLPVRAKSQTTCNISAMFNRCAAITVLDLSLFNVTTTSIANMFSNCTALTRTDISGVSGAITNIAFANNSSSNNKTFVIGDIDLSGVTTDSVNKLDIVTTLICTKEVTSAQDVPNSALFTYFKHSSLEIYVPDKSKSYYESAWTGKTIKGMSELNNA